MPTRRVAAAAAVVTALAVGATALTLAPGAAPQAAAAGLQPYGSCAALLEHYRGELVRGATPYGGPVDLGRDTVAASGGAALQSAQRAAAPSAALGDSGAVGAGETGTNVQERGVDEPDTAKLVGDLLVTVAQSRVQLVRTGDTPRVLSSYSLGEQGWGGEVLVEGDRVLVVVPRWEQPVPVEDGPALRGGASLASDVRIGVPGDPKTRLVLLDVADPAEPRLLEELELDGRYLSARLVDGTVRLVTASSPRLPGISPAEPYGAQQERAALEANRRAAREVGLDAVLPQAVRRDAAGREVDRGPAVACGAVRHPATPRGATTLLVTTLRPERGLAPVDSDGVTTDGELVYASQDRLYVATSRWGTAPLPVEPSDTATAPVEPEQVTTEVHAFDTSGPQATSYLGSGEVPGYVMGRWALSEHDGHLRVATTRQPPWSPEQQAQTSSSVVVLAERDGRLVETGRVDGLGKGERIYAVRYFGPLATVVTFRQVDPLYVLDLADPAAPRLLGELKVPGFSTYLHPIGDDRLLGVGQDADDQGRVTGMQVSVFDLSDLSAPVQLDRLPLGTGHSAALEDSRAFGYDPARRLALLPYGEWSGGPTSSAIGVRVAEDGSLSEAGRLSLRSQVPPSRVLHDAERVYAVTEHGVVAGSASDLQRTGAVSFGP